MDKRDREKSKRNWKYNEERDTLQRGLKIQIGILENIRLLLTIIAVAIALIMVLGISMYVLFSMGVF